MGGIRRSDGNPANHKGSIIRWKKYKYEKKNIWGTVGAIEDGWEEDILMEPIDYQLVLTLDRGPLVLSSREAQSVELIDADLWDDSCENKLQEFYNQLKEKENK